MKNTCWKYFSFLNIDYRDAQARLDQWVSEGWELVEVVGPFARLRQTERTDLTYFLDWSGSDEPKDYAQLLSDAGWELVDRMSYLNIYASRPGMRPSPIQTDPELEYQRFREKALRSTLLAAGLILFLAILGLLQMSGSDLSDLESFRLYNNFFVRFMAQSLVYSAAVVLSPFWLVGAIAYFNELYERMRLWRKALRDGEEPPRATERACRLWGALRGAAYFSLGLLLLLSLPDTLLNRQGWYYCIGPIFASGLVSFHNPAKKGYWKSTIVFFLAIAACLQLNAPLRNILPGRIPFGPAHSGASYVDLKTRRTDAFLGSYACWRESVKLGSEERIGINYTAQTWVSPAVARWAMDDVPEELVPVPGLEGVWQNFNWSEDQEFVDPDGNLQIIKASQSDHPIFHLRRGRMQMTVSCYNVPPEATIQEILEPILAWMEAAQ